MTCGLEHYCEFDIDTLVPARPSREAVVTAYGAIAKSASVVPIFLAGLVELSLTSLHQAENGVISMPLLRGLPSPGIGLIDHWPCFSIRVPFIPKNLNVTRSLQSIP